MTTPQVMPSGRLWVKGQNGWEDAKSLETIYTESISRYHAIKIIEAFLKKRLQKLSRSNYTNLTAAPVSKCSVREDVLWLQISSVGSRENQGYSTLGELIRRLDLSGSVWQQRRFSYVICLTELIAQQKFLELGGTAQKHFFQLIDCLVTRVVQTHERIRQMRQILWSLTRTVHKRHGNMIGSKTKWFMQVDFIRKCQTKLNLVEIKPRLDNRCTMTDMPWHIQEKIIAYLEDYEDLESVEMVNQNFSKICKRERLWEKMCKEQFTKKQINDAIRIIEHRTKMQKFRTGKSSYREPPTWREIYYVLAKSFRKSEHFADPLLLCKKCKIVFWEETGHPCVSPSEHTIEKITPSRLITYF